jgi:hypothetical protein
VDFPVPKPYASIISNSKENFACIYANRFYHFVPNRLPRLKIRLLKKPANASRLSVGVYSNFLGSFPLFFIVSVFPGNPLCASLADGYNPFLSAR